MVKRNPGETNPVTRSPPRTELRKKHLFLLLLGLAVLVPIILVIHELAHYLTSLLLGANPEQVSFRFCGINPCISHLPFSGWQQATIRVSGGLVAGGLLLTAWSIAIPRWSNSAGWWLANLSLATLGSQQVANGLVEWLANYAYQRGIVPYHLAASLGVGMHLAWTRRRSGNWHPFNQFPK